MASVVVATVGLVPKISRMVEIGCRTRRSEATARSVALGSGLGSVTGCVVGSPRLGERNRGGSNGIVSVGSPEFGDLLNENEE